MEIKFHQQKAQRGLLRQYRVDLLLCLKPCLKPNMGCILTMWGTILRSSAFVASLSQLEYFRGWTFNFESVMNSVHIIYSCSLTSPYFHNSWQFFRECVWQLVTTWIGLILRNWLVSATFGRGVKLQESGILSSRVQFRVFTIIYLFPTQARGSPLLSLYSLC